MFVCVNPRCSTYVLIFNGLCNARCRFNMYPPLSPKIICYLFLSTAELMQVCLSFRV